MKYGVFCNRTKQIPLQFPWHHCPLMKNKDSKLETEVLDVLSVLATSGTDCDLKHIYGMQSMRSGTAASQTWNL